MRKGYKWPLKQKQTSWKLLISARPQNQNNLRWENSNGA